MQRLQIVAAIIFNANQDEIYITQRPKQVHKGGYWEFPGGKVEQGESAQQALSRELFEEIGIEVTVAEHFKALDYDYPEKSLSFDFFVVTEFNQQPYGKEGQVGQWVKVAQLADYTFPEANVPVLEQVLQQYG